MGPLGSNISLEPLRLFSISNQRRQDTAVAFANKLKHFFSISAFVVEDVVLDWSVEESGFLSDNADGLSEVMKIEAV